ncbi:hypothetical protein, partial [Streptomyces spongiicola]|uniref:hypothetical protein n=1 Tax=Streptomyces spongiicola TaxID=1690221 RepID=UPI0011C0EB98
MTGNASEAGQPDQAVPEEAPRPGNGWAAASANSDALTAGVASRAAARMQEQFNSPLVEAAARMQEQFNSPLVEAAARMQEQFNSP